MTYGYDAVYWVPEEDPLLASAIQDLADAMEEDDVGD